jgi:hypothetical protein
MTYEISKPFGGTMSLIEEPFNNLLANINLPTPVEILLLQSVPPKWVQATLLPLEEGDLITVQLEPNESPIIIPFGSKIILHFANEEGPMLSLRYYDQEKNKIHLQFSQVHQRDKRSFPRHYGNIPMSFRVLTKEEEELATKQWIGNSINTNELWTTPEPFMNFSLGGLSFEHSTSLTYGTMLLLNIGIGQSQQRWRATGHVVRSIEINSSSFDIAIEFSILPDGALEELSDLTLSVQEALL